MRRTIVTMGGGGFSMEPENPALDLWILSLATPTLRRSGQDPDWRPTVCFIPTASGDSERYVLNFYKAFAKLPCRATHLSLFQRETLDVRTILHAADVIYVGGGNTANLLAVWRLHNVDKALRAAWRRGPGWRLRGVAVLVRGGYHRQLRSQAGATCRWTRFPARQSLPALRRRGATSSALPAPGGSRRTPRRLGVRRQCSDPLARSPRRRVRCVEARSESLAHRADARRQGAGDSARAPCSQSRSYLIRLFAKSSPGPRPGAMS